MPGNDAKRTCQRLSEKDLLELIIQLSKPDPPSKLSLAQEYGVTEGALWEHSGLRGSDSLQRVSRWSRW